MPKRKSKEYKQPRKLYDSVRIKEEDNLVKKYGLKNKREIWKAEFAIGKIRDIAKKLITATKEEQEKFLERQKEKGFDVKTIADVLGLNKEDYLKRRLQSIIVKKGLAKTPRQARQFIAHKHILVCGNKMNSPSHLTTLDEEEKILLNISIPLKKELEDKEKRLFEEIKGGEKMEVSEE